MQHELEIAKRGIEHEANVYGNSAQQCANEWPAKDTHTNWCNYQATENEDVAEDQV